MFNQPFGNQTPGGMFPFFDQMGDGIPPLVKWCLAIVGGVGGYWWGQSHPDIPLMLPVIVGFLLGLLSPTLALKSLGGLLALAIIAACAYAAFWLCVHDPHTSQPSTTPAIRQAPRRTEQSPFSQAVEYLRREVEL